MNKPSDSGHKMTTAGLLCDVPTVSPEMLNSEVFEIFSADSGLRFLPVVDAGKPVGLVTRADLINRFAQRYQREIFGKKPCSTIMDENFLTVDKSTTPLEFSLAIAEADFDHLPEGFIITDQGAYLGICTAHDLMRLTTRMQVDAEVARTAEANRAKAELEAANLRLQKLDTLKSDFLSSVSHELRTPLTSIRGFAHLVEREFSRSFAPLTGENAGLSKKSARIQENLEIILKESERLTRLINDVLDLAKIESGRVDWHDTVLKVDALVIDAINAVRGMFDVKPEVALRYEIQDPPPVVFGDADRLEQVLINLLNNAAKFTERGEVRVGVFLNDKLMIQIEIRDTGAGFPPEDAEKIFDKFQQASHGDTLTDKPNGTGLGLAIAREIVERHGGRIWASSTPGVGSVFALELPPASVAQDEAQKVGAGETAKRAPDGVPEVHAAPAEMPPDRADNRRMRVLVVDDDPAVRSYFSQLLQEQDYEVVTAADGEAAIAAARRYVPDLITMDMAMPVMDGRTAIGRLRADPELARIPIMVISAIAGWDAAGGDVAMSKPLDEQRFFDNIHTLLADDAPGRTIELLVLCRDGDERGHFPLRFTANCHITYCPLADLEQRIRSSFRGMLAIPVDLLNKVDIDGLHAMPDLKVMIFPTASGESGRVAS